MATNVVEAKDDGEHSADVATGVVDVDNNGRDGADMAAETGGGMDNNGHVGDVAHPGAVNRQLGGQIRGVTHLVAPCFLSCSLSCSLLLDLSSSSLSNPSFVARSP